MNYETFLHNIKESLSFFIKAFSKESLLEELIEESKINPSKLPGTHQRLLTQSSQMACIGSLFKTDTVLSFENLYEKNVFQLFNDFADHTSCFSKHLLPKITDYRTLIDHFNDRCEITTSKKACSLEKIFASLYFLSVAWLVYILFQINLNKIDVDILEHPRVEPADTAFLFKCLKDIMIVTNIWDISLEGAMMVDTSLLDEQLTKKTSEDGELLHYLSTDLKSIFENMCILNKSLFEEQASQMHLFYIAHQRRISCAFAWLTKNYKALKPLDAFLSHRAINTVAFLCLSLAWDPLFFIKHKAKVVLHLLEIFGDMVSACLVLLEDKIEKSASCFALVDLVQLFKRICREDRQTAILIDCCLFAVLNLKIQRLTVQLSKKPYLSKFKNIREVMSVLLIHLPFEDDLSSIPLMLLSVVKSK